MKVGILTYHRAHNYGAVLQCYALQEVLKGMGHEVEIIDYRQPWIEDFYKVFSFSVLHRGRQGIRSKIRYIVSASKRINTVRLKKDIFNLFLKKYIKQSEPCYKKLPQYYDAYVIGSDQLWSLHCLGFRKEPIYLGSFKHKESSKVIGYAISVNEKSIKELLDDNLIKELDNFDNLSLREPFAIDLLHNYTNKPIDLCVDPTILTSADTWNSMTTASTWKSRNYVLTYQVRYANNSKRFIREQAALIATGISDIDGSSVEIININELNPTVDEFVSLFKYARFVITSSFHATVFSLIFNTPFYSVLLKDGKDGRYENLLHQLNADDRLVNVGSFRKYAECDFNPIMQKIPEIRKNSIQYLLKSFS